MLPIISRKNINERERERLSRTELKHNNPLLAFQTENTNINEFEKM